MSPEPKSKKWSVVDEWDIIFGWTILQRTTPHSVCLLNTLNFECLCTLCPQCDSEQARRNCGWHSRDLAPSHFYLSSSRDGLPEPHPLLKPLRRFCSLSFNQQLRRYLLLMFPVCCMNILYRANAIFEINLTELSYNFLINSILEAKPVQTNQ